MKEADNMHYIIYMYTFPNNKKYIGKTKRSLSARQGVNWVGYRRCTLLWKAIQKYGIENITTSILFEGDLTHKEANKMENKYIEKYKTNVNKYNNPSFGYNLTSGGDGLLEWHPSEERLEKLRKQIRHEAEKRKGVPLTDEHKMKLSKSHKGIRNGYKMPEETKRKIGKSNSLENMTKEERLRRSKSKQKKVMALNKNMDEVLLFESRTEAAEYFHVASSMITRWINGTRIPQNNYIFRDYSRTTTK